MTIAIIIQARMGSERLPGKVLKNLHGMPMLCQILRRVSKAKHHDKLIVATTDSSQDDPIAAACKRGSIHCFRGHPTDVLDRYYNAAKEMQADIIVRLTADNPFADPFVIDAAIEKYMKLDQYDYLHYSQGMPLGVSVEVFSFKALERAWTEAISDEDREHVTSYIYLSGEYRCHLDRLDGVDHSDVRLTVDTIEDFITAEKIYEELYDENVIFTYNEVMDFLAEHPSAVHNKNILQRQLKRQARSDEVQRG